MCCIMYMLRHFLGCHKTKFEGIGCGVGVAAQKCYTNSRCALLLPPEGCCILLHTPKDCCILLRPLLYCTYPVLSCPCPPLDFPALYCTLLHSECISILIKMLSAFPMTLAHFQYIGISKNRPEFDSKARNY